MPMSSGRWKRWEREVAGSLGTVRSLHRDGKAGADVETPTHSIQVKTRKALPEWFTDAWAQAHVDTLDGKQPALVIVLAPGQGIRAKRWVVLDFDTWAQELTERER